MLMLSIAVVFARIYWVKNSIAFKATHYTKLLSYPLVLLQHNPNITTQHCIQHNFNTLRQRQNGHYFPDNIFNLILLNENVSISIKISLKFVPKGPINNVSALVQITACRRSGDKPLSEPMMVKLPMHMSLGLNELSRSQINSLPHCGLVTPHSNIGSGKGLLPASTKLLPEQCWLFSWHINSSSYHQRHSVVFTWEQFHKCMLMNLMHNICS